MTLEDLNSEVRKFYPKFVGFSPSQDSCKIHVGVVGRSGRTITVTIDMLDWFSIDGSKPLSEAAKLRLLRNLALLRIEAALQQ